MTKPSPRSHETRTPRYLGLWEMRLRLLLGAAFIALAVAYLMWTGTNQAMVYYVTVTEAIQGVETHNGDPLRVQGRVHGGSIDWQPQRLQLRFELSDGEHRLPVSYHGLLPESFASEREVIVEGRLTTDGLQASDILTSCPSKYEAADGATVVLDRNAR